MYGGIDDIVAELRALRVASLEYRQRRDVPPKLPSRKALATIVEGLSAALFCAIIAMVLNERGLS